MEIGYLQASAWRARGRLVRVLLVVHQFLPKHSFGTEVLTRDTGLEMLRRGHEVHVLTTNPEAQGKSLDVRHEDYKYRGLKVHSLWLPGRRSALEAFRGEYDNRLVVERVRVYVEQIEPDAVHVFHLSRLSASVIEVFRDLDVPLVFTPTDFWSICARATLSKPSGELSTGPDDISSNCLECREAERFLPSSLLPDVNDKRIFYRKLAERALAREEGEHRNMAVLRTMLARTEVLRVRFNAVDAILAPTDFMREMLTINGIDPDIVTVSPYGMDTSSFRDAGRVRHDGGGRSLRVGFIGAINPNKGLDVLIAAFKKLPVDEAVTLRVCGGLEGQREYANETYAAAGGDPRINFAGAFPNEKMAAELGKIDVLVVPSVWYENAPLVIYSALAAGVPVVATNLGGMAGIIRHEENGLLFGLRDSEDLARQLGRLLNEPGLLESLAANAGEIRTVQDSVDEMLGLYEAIRENKSGARSAG
jgi:glycosyltransferase involved in cell wall biosynthesis